MKYNQLPIRMQIRYISLVLSLLCLISSCRESGHDPGKELYEPSLDSESFTATVEAQQGRSSSAMTPSSIARSLTSAELSALVSVLTLSKRSWQVVTTATSKR